MAKAKLDSLIRQIHIDLAVKFEDIEAIMAKVWPNAVFDNENFKTDNEGAWYKSAKHYRVWNSPEGKTCSPDEMENQGPCVCIWEDEDTFCLDFTFCDRQSVAKFIQKFNLLTKNIKLGAED